MQKKNNKKHPPAKVFKDCHHSSRSSVKLIVIYSSIKIHCSTVEVIQPIVFLFILRNKIVIHMERYS